MAGHGEQGRDPRSLLVAVIPAAGPRAEVDLRDRGIRPDPGEHRVGVADVPRELGELPHRIVAALSEIVPAGSRDQTCLPSRTPDIPCQSSYRYASANRCGT